MAEGLRIDLSSNIARVKATFGSTVAAIEEKAITRALNRAGAQAITEAKRGIRETYRIKASDLSKHIAVRGRARRGALYFTVRFFGGRIPLMEFGARQTRRGVTVGVKKGGSRKLIPGAFIARMQSGHVGVFARAGSSKALNPVFRRGPGSGKPGRRWGDPDLPIVELFTLDVPTMFREKTVRAAVARKAVESFVKNFEQQLAYLRGL